MALGEDIVPIPGTKRWKYMEENAAAAQLRGDRLDHAAFAGRPLEGLEQGTGQRRRDRRRPKPTAMNSHMSLAIAEAGLVSALLTSATSAALQAPLNMAVRLVTRTMPRHVRRMNLNSSIGKNGGRACGYRGQTRSPAMNQAAT